MGKEKRPFCCHKFFVPNGLSAPVWGYIYMWKKKYIKTVKNQTSKRFFFKLATNGQSDKEFIPKTRFLMTRLSCIKSFKMCLKSYFKETVLKLAANGQSDKGFMLTSTFVPKGLSDVVTLRVSPCMKVQLLKFETEAGDPTPKDILSIAWTSLKVKSRCTTQNIPQLSAKT